MNKYLKNPDHYIAKRIHLIKMGEDPNPIEPDTEGTIHGIGRLGDIEVTWDNGRILSLIPHLDEFIIL